LVKISCKNTENFSENNAENFHLKILYH